MKRIRQAAGSSALVVFFAAVCAKAAARQDAALAVTFGVLAGFFLAFAVGCVAMHFDERAERAARARST